MGSCQSTSRRDFFPYYKKNIHFASLSLNKGGVTGYGNCCLILKEIAIQNRASVFHENLTVFITKTKCLIPGDEVPSGYRATWDMRADLAVAKLAQDLTPGMKETDFADLVMGSTDRQGQFLEVHIYGSITRLTVQHAIFKQPSDKANIAIIASVRRKLREVGVTSEIIR